MLKKCISTVLAFCMACILFFSTASAATPVYRVYNSSGVLQSSHSSLFEAIDKTGTYGLNSFVGKDGASNVVFLRNNSTSTYYKYQFTAYYGSTTSLSNAQAWVNDYAYTHVIDGTGRFILNSYTSLKGTPDSWTKEPNNGGYLYKFSNTISNYRKQYSRINLSNAKIKPSSGSQNFNAYIYMSAQNSSITTDMGLYFGWANGGEWRLCSSVNGNFIDYGVICGSTFASGVYTPNADIDMTFSYTSGSVTISVVNLSTNVTTTRTVYNSLIGGNMALISGTSYVPDISSSQTPDYRNGGYLLNVEYQDCLIYNSSGTAYNFYFDSSPINYTFAYNDDTCATAVVGSGSSRKDIVTVFYDREYTE